MLIKNGALAQEGRVAFYKAISDEEKQVWFPAIQCLHKSA